MLKGRICHFANWQIRQIRLFNTKATIIRDDGTPLIGEHTCMATNVVLFFTHWGSQFLFFIFHILRFSALSLSIQLEKIVVYILDCLEKSMNTSISYGERGVQSQTWLILMLNIHNIVKINPKLTSCMILYSGVFWYKHNSWIKYRNISLTKVYTQKDSWVYTAEFSRLGIKWCQMTLSTL